MILPFRIDPIEAFGYRQVEAGVRVLIPIDWPDRLERIYHPLAKQSIFALTLVDVESGGFVVFVVIEEQIEMTTRDKAPQNDRLGDTII